MQDWISGELQEKYGLAELILDPEWLDTAVPKHAGEHQVLLAYQRSLNALFDTCTVFENEDISASASDTLKPDFVLYSPEQESIVVVELKNIAGPTRQAGTELGAYSAELRTLVPFLSDGDVVHVLISQEWPALLKHYARHEIFWHGRNLICLRPILLSNGQPSLEILPLADLAEDYASFQIGAGHLGGYVVCLYDDELYKPGADRDRLAAAIRVFEVGLHTMAVAGNRLNSHGFAFLWRTQSPISLAPFCYTVVNLAPFTTLDRYVVGGVMPDAVRRLVDEVVVQHSPAGHGATLNAISEAAVRIVDCVCEPRHENFTSWECLQTQLGSVELLAFAGWGMFGQAAVEEVSARHRAGDLDCVLSCPTVGQKVVSSLIDSSRSVLNVAQMFAPEAGGGPNPDRPA